jgi:SulP family sulfate permease
MNAPNPASRLSRVEAWLPKTVVCLREGYTRSTFARDLIAGLTVGVIALPLAIGLAIGSGPPGTIRPEQGLFTAVIAGFVASFLGGSRVSIAGPTGAFMPILFTIVAGHGYEGLAIATLMAGIFLIILGISKLGSLIKYIPYPVTTGFTTGIAVIIGFSQLKDLLGLRSDAKTPAEFIERCAWYVHAVRENGVNITSALIGVTGVASMLTLKRLAPRVPAYIIAVVLAGAVTALFQLDSVDRFGAHAVATIGSQFGGIPRALPSPNLDFLSHITLDKVRELMPAAVTITLLAGIESLLCCVVADGMMGTRHRSNVELVAQGAANLGSVAFGGIPATGAIARTAANIKSGARTPFAGMIHAVFVLVAMLTLAPYASKIPMAIFASVLIVVAWNMAEVDHFKGLIRAPRGDVVVLLLTFGLTVLVDLTIAVGVGMVLASLMFMKRMSEVTSLGVVKEEIDEVEDRKIDVKDRADLTRRFIPPGVEVFEINGPFFFGVADRLKDVLRGVQRPPRVFILRMRRVPAIDATGMHALEEFFDKCRKQGTTLLLAGVHAQPLFAMSQYGLTDRVGVDHLFEDFDDALERARELVHNQPETRMHKRPN